MPITNADLKKRVFVRENDRWENNGDVLEHIYNLAKGITPGLVSVSSRNGKFRIETTDSVRVIEPRG